MESPFVFFSMCVIESMCYQFPKVTPSQPHIPIVNLGGINQSLVYITVNDTENELINSFLSEVYSDQSVIVATGEGFKNARKPLVYKSPNVVIFMEKLCLDNLKTTAFKTLFISYRSQVYLIITSRSKNQICHNGTLSNTFLEDAQNYMNKIWHRYRSIRVTLSFPNTCPQYYIILSGKKPSFTILYDRTIKVVRAKNKKELKTIQLESTKLKDLMEGYPLKAHVFDRFPTSIKPCYNIEHYVDINYNYTNGYCGMDGIVMHDFIKYFQYKLMIPKDDRCDEYGFVKPVVGDVTGVLGCIIREQVDISFNSRFMIAYNTSLYYYLHYIGVDSLAVVLRRPKIVPLWHYAYNSYSFKATIILLILIVLLGVVTWAWTWITRNIYKEKPRKLLTYIANALTCTLFGFGIERGRERFRILRGTSLVCSIILLAIYQGSVSKQFTTRTRDKELKTLQELYHSKYVLYTSPSIKQILLNYANPRDDVQVTYLNRTRIKSDSVSTGYVYDHPDAATLVRGEDVLIEVLLNFTDELGFPMIYRIDEPFHLYYLSYIARAGFPFVEESIRFMLRLLEAGLPNRYYLWTRQTLKMGESSTISETEPRPIAKIELSNLRVAFCVLGLGYLISTCTFLIEKHLGKRQNRMP